MSSSPHALVIEDNTAHAVIAEVLLGECGFHVELAASLAAGTRRALSLLDRAHPPVPTLILLDLKLPDPRVPSLEGSMLACQLAEGMETGLLRAAHLVAITSELTEQRRQEALLAGCALVIAKPLGREQARQLRALVEMPPAIPVHTAQASEPAWQLSRQLLRRASAQVLEALEAAYGATLPAPEQGQPLGPGQSDPPHAPAADEGVARGTLGEGAPAQRSPGADGEAAMPPSTIWDEQHVRELLFRPTALLRADPWGGWIRARGGLQALRARLAQVPLPEELRPMLAELLRSGAGWHSYTARFHIGRMTYYRHLKRLLVELATALNEW